MQTVSDLIQQAIDSKGSQTALAKAAGVTQNAIWQARAAGRVSAELAVNIDRATDGEVPCWKLRPDLWPAPSETGAAA